MAQTKQHAEGGIQMYTCIGCKRHLKMNGKKATILRCARCCRLLREGKPTDITGHRGAW